MNINDDALWIVRKSAREQRGELAQHALWSAVKRIARRHAHQDGFVDWNVVEQVFDDLFNHLTDHHKFLPPFQPTSTPDLCWKCGLNKSEHEP